MVGTVSFVNLTSALSGGWSLHYSNNPGQGHGGSGGTCFGDSGGPVISEDGYIVAVNSFVLNNNCNGAGFGYRVDTQLAQRVHLRIAAMGSGGDTRCRPPTPPDTASPRRARAASSSGELLPNG